MSFAAAEKLIQDTVVASWPYPAVPLFFQNQNVNAPKGPFVEVHVIGSKETIAAFGGGRGQNEIEIVGVIHGMFFIPLVGAPMELGSNLRDAFCSIFRYKTFGPSRTLRCLGASPIGGDSTADSGKHFLLEAAVDFEYRFRG